MARIDMIEVVLVAIAGGGGGGSYWDRRKGEYMSIRKERST